jgi:hypothetical protein
LTRLEEVLKRPEKKNPPRRLAAGGAGRENPAERKTVLAMIAGRNQKSGEIR